MRPIRLEMEGFTSFRDKTVVDFEGADLFVLTGPTGAGKSSVIDAITFALYGSIPRLDDRRLVAPVISRGLSRARVSLDFSVGDKRYRAVRVARATKAGATTPEARLEDDAENTLAGNGKELSDKVEEILGLSFEHFTRCVVLPQGDFAELLHEKPSERQRMLQRLLGTELFGRLASRARARNTDANADINSWQADIDRKVADGVTQEGLEAASGKAAELDDLGRRIQETRPRLDKLRDRVSTAEGQQEEIEAHIVRLADTRTPRGITELARKVAEARREDKAAREVRAEAMTERQHRHDERAALPQEGKLQLQMKLHDDLAKAQRERDKAAEGLEKARAVLKEARAEATQAEAAVAEAELGQRAMEDRHRAFHLASTLEAGDACPVCLQHISEPPNLEPPEELGVLNEALNSAQRGSKEAAKRLADAQSDVDQWSGGCKSSAKQVQELEEALQDTPSHEELKDLLAQVASADDALKEAIAAEDESRLRLTEAEGAVKALEEDESEAWRTYHEQRDRVAELDPPAAYRQDLSAAWGKLADWANEQAEKQPALLADAEKEHRSAEGALEELEETISRWCRDAGVNVAADEESLTASSRELGQQQAAVKLLVKELADLDRRRDAVELRRKEATVAADLALNLRSDRFEGWLMAQVLEQLCVEASKELRKLSSDGYSLALNERNDFVVVDHQNADERRPVKTLSGGETFLASLSLALSLSTQLVDLAVGGAPKLEALFLDEGFGTLDPDTLDMVTDAIEELGSDGKMVGVVTHVPGLAEHMPVRCEVSKRGNRSLIERVEA